MNTPLLFIVFNRPDPTERVFEEIRKAKPQRLFIAADGPRNDKPEDVEKCRLTREVVENVDWPCEVQTLFQDKNLGCKIAVSSAINWFFENVEEGIILEDDCLPDPSFFPFCTELLEKYRNNEKVMLISGFNMIGQSNINESYFFSKYIGIWGWATWRRVWAQYDIKMTSWADKNNRIRVKKTINNRRSWKVRSWIYNELYLNKKNTWDYQLEYCILSKNGLSIVPKVNLVENIGFDEGATHTVIGKGGFTVPERHRIESPLKYNDNIRENKEYDNRLIASITKPTLITLLKQYFRSRMPKLKNIIKSITPPFFYLAIKKIILGDKRFVPTWNRFNYYPMTGIQMYFDPSGSFQKKMISNTYDTFLFDRLKLINMEGKTVFDIGAHIGFHTFYFGRLVGPTGTVYAFEPNPCNAERLKFIQGHNPDIKDRVSVFEIAISDKEGTEEFTLNNDIESGRSSGNFIESADPLWSREVYAKKGFSNAKVKTVRIDKLKENIGIQKLPDIIKIDVEGAEYGVLLGAKETLTTAKPILFIEIHSMQNMFNVISFLHSLEYKTQILKVEDNGTCYIEAEAKS